MMKNWGPLHEVFWLDGGPKFEVQRTGKRAELTAFLSLLKKVIGPIEVHVDNKGNHRWALERRKKNASNRKLEMLFVDQHLGRIASVKLTRNCGGSEACQGAPHKEGTRKICRIV